MSGIGHNRGPSLDEGASWRRHCWSQARRDLLPTLPLEILRLRVARAKAIGLEYRTYATVRASTGQDIVALLFSSNALRLFAPQPVLPADRAVRLAAIAACGRIAVVQDPLTPGAVLGLADARLDAAWPAPGPAARWRDIRANLRGALHGSKLAPDAVLLIGDAPWEADWSGAAALAGFLPADRFFANPLG